MSELFSEKIITEIIEFILKYCQKNDNANNINLMISLSGGVDSVTLLYSLYLIKKYNLLDGKNINLSAIYIHHGISKNADSWLAFCENICHEFSIKFFGKRIQLNQNNIMQAIAGEQDNTFLKRWGGELKLEGYDIYINSGL